MRKRTLVDSDISTIANKFIRNHLEQLEASKCIVNEKYVDWFARLIDTSYPDGFYVVEDQKIIYPNGLQKFYPSLPRYSPN